MIDIGFSPGFFNGFGCKNLLDGLDIGFENSNGYWMFNQSTSDANIGWLSRQNNGMFALFFDYG